MCLIRKDGLSEREEPECMSEGGGEKDSSTPSPLTDIYTPRTHTDLSSAIAPNLVVQKDDEHRTVSS